jgi:hypothetical protein
MFSDHVLLSNINPFTFYSDAHASVSWLDHIISTEGVHDAIISVQVLSDYVTSDHLPIVVELQVGRITPVITTETCADKYSVRWSELSSKEIDDYQKQTAALLECMYVNEGVMSCDNSNCTLADHTEAINTMYTSLIDMFNCASAGIRVKRKTYKQVPGWNEYCQEAHTAAREAFIMWQVNGKQKQGTIFHTMQQTRAQFKAALRYCRSIESKAKADAIARKFLLKDTKSFWKEIKNVNSEGSCILPSTVGGETGVNKICDMWQKHYQNLLNSNTDISCKDGVLQSLSHIEGFKDDVVFQTCDVARAIKKLKSGKSAGLDGIQAEHVKHCDVRINEYLSMLLTCMVRHSYLPDDLMKTIIVPVVKDKRGNVTDKDNYRPIALTTVMSKVLELLILDKIELELYTCDNQFGFKSKHSTDMCTFALKQVLEYYTSLSSPVYLCYMDASKAFDRLNYWNLFSKLLQRNIPKLIIRLLVFWYSTQQCVIRWGSQISNPFLVSNGVRQGGILSPLLFNVYMDNLSEQLIQSNIGCKYNGLITNHFMYADDAVVCAPSPYSLQKLLIICEQFAIANNIAYNVKKTVCMCVKPKSFKNLRLPEFVLNGKVLNYVSTHSYLGVMLNEDRSDNHDLLRQLKSLYARGNMVVRKFKHCSENVKMQLFKTYCSNFYAAHLWSNYKTKVHNKVKVAFNDVYRKLFSIKRGVSISERFMLYGLDHFYVLLRKGIYGFRERIYESDNSILSAITSSVFFYSCDISRKWYELLFKCSSY